MKTTQATQHGLKALNAAIKLSLKALDAARTPAERERIAGELEVMTLRLHEMMGW